MFGSLFQALVEINLFGNGAVFILISLALALSFALTRKNKDVSDTLILFNGMLLIMAILIRNYSMLDATGILIIFLLSAGVTAFFGLKRLNIVSLIKGKD